MTNKCSICSSPIENGECSYCGTPDFDTNEEDDYKEEQPWAD